MSPPLVSGLLARTGAKMRAGTGEKGQAQIGNSARGVMFRTSGLRLGRFQSSRGAAGLSLGRVGKGTCRSTFAGIAGHPPIEPAHREKETDHFDEFKCHYV